MNNEVKNWHIQFGRASGIPECCIEFFVNEWLYICANCPKMFTSYHNKITLNRTILGRDFIHIPCPVCLDSGNVINVKKCDCPIKIDFDKVRISRTFDTIIDNHTGLVLGIKYINPDQSQS